MKKSNKKLLTLILTGALCATTLGAGFTALSASADTATTTETAKTYLLTDVFSADKGIISADKKNGGENESETMKFTLGNAQSVKFNRDLALKWYAEGVMSTFTAEFAFADMNFTEISFTFESESSMSANDGKAINVIKFVKTGDTSVNVSVNGGTAVAKTIELKKTMTITLAPDATVWDAYKVKLDGADIGTFTNIGVEYAEYTLGKMTPLTISAKTANDATTGLYIESMNGQRFDNVTTKEGSTNKYVADTTAPVLVVDEDIEDAFLLGTSFSFSYQTIDVLPSSIDEKKTYYQYNPADGAITYNALNSSPYFVDTVYYKGADGKAYKTVEDAQEAGVDYETVSVFEEEISANGIGREFVSLKITLSDGTYKVGATTYPAKEYELAWFVGANAVEKKTVKVSEKYEENGEEKTREVDKEIDFVIFNREENGPVYSLLVKDDTNKKNLYLKADGTATENYEESTLKDWVENKYQVALNAVADETVAGSNSYINFPAVKDLISDTNGYSNMKFTISYKTPSSDSAKTSSGLAYNALKLAVSEEGKYEFKIFAVDKAGNKMYYYLDDELQEVSTSNVWDIEEIPSFTFEIKNQGLSIKDEKSSDRQDTELIGETYKFSDATVVGATAQKSDYALYKVDLNAYNTTLTPSQTKLTTGHLSQITYKTLNEKVKNKVATDGDYFKVYMDVYAEELASLVGGTQETKDAILKCFTRIEEYNSKITEKDEEWAHNKYQWKPASKSFETVEEGEFLIVADYWESELPHQRATAYTLVLVNSKRVTNPGESDWLKNNVVSVVLFSIAGVMLVMIIILLLIKPSDEKLEEVEENAEKATKKKKKK